VLKRPKRIGKAAWPANLHCAIGNTPLLTVRLCNPDFACQNAALATAFSEIA
jgi:hypothetical protein